MTNFVYQGCPQGGAANSVDALAVWLEKVRCKILKSQAAEAAEALILSDSLLLSFLSFRCHLSLSFLSHHLVLGPGGAGWEWFREQKTWKSQNYCRSHLKKYRKNPQRQNQNQHSKRTPPRSPPPPHPQQPQTMKHWEQTATSNNSDGPAQPTSSFAWWPQQFPNCHQSSCIIPDEKVSYHHDLLQDSPYAVRPMLPTSHEQAFSSL